jgi:hypothetical protein
MILFLMLTALAQSTHVPAPNQAKVVTIESEWSACIADAKKLSPKVAKYTRYHTFAFTRPRDREAWKLMHIFQLWSISREAEPPRPRRISDTLYAIYLPDYGIDPLVYGKLTFTDPYFHVRLTDNGVKPDGNTPSPAPWVGSVENQTLLRTLVDSQAPLLRADWFVVEVSIQDGRNGTGYYDFIGVKNLAEFQRAVGADPKLADEAKKRWRAVVKKSGISKFPREIERFGALDGGYWFTLDVLDKGTDKKNPIRNPFTFVHDVEEHYGKGPAGLPWYFLSNNKGERQDSAPDKIGTDTTRKGNRRIIDIGASCIRCHEEILRPIDNWVKETLKIPATGEFDEEKAIEIRRLFFRDLQGKLDRDRQDYVERLKECNGLTPKKNAENYGRLWDSYVEDQLTLNDCAREVGTNPNRLATTLAAVQAQGKLDPVLLDLISNPPSGVLREHWEEVFPIVQIYLGNKP